jgi:uncharacterized protein (DUF924 family)
MNEYQEVLKFWFEELKPNDRFKKDPKLDRQINEKFGQALEKAKRGELFSWRENARGRLAEITVLDQFSRNIFRDDARAFAGDSIALVLAQEAVRLKCDQEVSPEMRAFFYIPYMHSESLLIHDVAVKLFSQPDLESNLEYEFRHRKILERFGRYPHRNKILNRESTPEEIEFLKGPDSTF